MSEPLVQWVSGHVSSDRPSRVSFVLCFIIRFVSTVHVALPSYSPSERERTSIILSSRPSTSSDLLVAVGLPQMVTHQDGEEMCVVHQHGHHFYGEDLEESLIKGIKAVWAGVPPVRINWFMSYNPRKTNS